jgi:Oxygenase, catalysing oxidative methylation of damaged DNA
MLCFHENRADCVMPITTVRPYFTGYCLHQSLCCEFMLPMQLAILLSSLQKNITGGEFVLAGPRSYRGRAELFRWCKAAISSCPTGGLGRVSKRGALRIRAAASHRGPRRAVATTQPAPWRSRGPHRDAACLLIDGQALRGPPGPSGRRSSSCSANAGLALRNDQIEQRQN